MNPSDLPQTPLQLALQGPDAAALLRAHTQRLQQCRRQLEQRLALGLAPTDYTSCQQQLALCDAALRVLHTQSPTTAVVPTGPAAALPRLVLTP
jgi:Type III secretion system, cytoplasmic E component of needle